jgi:2-(1,2-epoxy-1,2-dihydrophenyl)acetyl-CoA isomerase
MSDYQLAHAYDTVNLYRSGAVAKIELNRPSTLNAWTKQFGIDLGDAVTTVAEDEAVRVVVVTGAGRGFSSGADIRGGGDGSHPTTLEGDPDTYTLLTTYYHPVITGIRRMPKPVVAAVNGPAVGIGCSLALACDLVAARRSAYLLLAFVNIGLVPDGGSSVFVPARVGLARAAEMAMLGEKVGAEQAASWGLINWAWPDEEFDERVEALVTRLANGPTRSYAGAKREFNARTYDGIDEQLDLEARLQQEQIGTKDFAEGTAAFAEKRPARFTGA